MEQKPRAPLVERPEQVRAGASRRQETQGQAGDGEQPGRACDAGGLGRMPRAVLDDRPLKTPDSVHEAPLQPESRAGSPNTSPASGWPFLPPGLSSVNAGGEGQALNKEPSPGKKDLTPPLGICVTLGS